MSHNTIHISIDMIYPVNTPVHGLDAIFNPMLSDTYPDDFSVPRSLSYCLNNIYDCFIVPPLKETSEVVLRSESI